jgi:hypothetical protein
MSVYQEIRKSGSIRRGDRRRTKREAAKMGFSELKSQTGSAMEELSVELALKHIEEEMELEADRLAGAAKGKHCRNRTGKRHGYATGYVIMHGRKIQIDRPRVRSLDNKTEFELASYLWARAQFILLPPLSVRVSQLPVGARAHGFGYDGPSFAAQRHIHQSLQARRGHCRIHTGRHM